MDSDKFLRFADVHGDIRHLEMMLISRAELVRVHGDIRHLEIMI